MENIFFNEIRLIDQTITDMCPSVSTRFVVQYNKKFNYVGHLLMIEFG